MDPLSLARLAPLNPEFARRILVLSDLQNAAGEPIKVAQAFRSWADQQKEWNQGRTTPGPIVSNAPPGHSWHEFGLAADVCPIRLLTVKGWGPADPAWAAMGARGKRLGLFWGGDFVHCPPDRPHFQLTGIFPVSPDDEVRQIITQYGMAAVWQAAKITSGETK